MRNILAFTILAILGCLTFFPEPDQARDSLGELNRFVQDLRFKKEIHFTGNEMVPEAELRSFLPEEKSIFWWLRKKSEIEMTLAQNPLVKDAAVKTCGSFSWGCFNIDIKERQAELLVRIGEEVWIVGKDGGFMIPAEEYKLRSSKELSGEIDFEQIPIVDGLVNNKVSPEIGRARYQYVQKAIGLIEDGTDQKVRHLSVRENGELVARFKGLSLRAVFDVAEEDFAGFREEVLRLKLILREFGKDADRIESIDLAFNKLGVVKFVDNR